MLPFLLAKLGPPRKAVARFHVICPIKKASQNDDLGLPGGLTGWRGLTEFAQLFLFFAPD